MVATTMTELHQKSLLDLVEALHGREVSAPELMTETLQRIDDTHEMLNAMIARRDRDQLLSDAEAAQARIDRGEARPLEGIPLGVKDLEDVAGMVTTLGSLPFRDNIAKHDSVQVARLKAAGAIVVGKTNTPEFGSSGVTKNRIFGATRSPWDRSRTPGGSSGGSAALIAAEAIPLVTATDGGGSIRIPASFVGAFGLKTSQGRIPNGPRDQHGTWDHSMTAVFGALTKTVEDAAYFLDQVAGYHPSDPVSLPDPGISYLDAVRGEALRPLRIGYSPDLDYGVVQSDVAAVAEEAAQVFEGLGHKLVQIPGGPPEMGAHWGLLGAFAMAGRLWPLLRTREQDFGRALMGTMKMAMSGVDAEWWGELESLRGKLVDWCAEVFDQVDLLVTPTLPYDPPPAKGPFPPETEGELQRVASVAVFTIPFNLSWHPAATVRAGYSKAGFPVGLQIVAPHHRDDLVLRASRAFERERPWREEWPLRRANETVTVAS